MSDAERIWREKSDDDLLEAAAQLDEFTDEGQRIIRAELKRRGMEDPLEQGGDDAEDETAEDEEAPILCLRCRAPLRFVETDKDGSPRFEWFGQRFPLYDPTGMLQVYACPRCGHLELFVNLPEEPEEDASE